MNSLKKEENASLPVLNWYKATTEKWTSFSKRSTALLATKLTHQKNTQKNDPKTNRTQVNSTGKAFNMDTKVDGCQPWTADRYASSCKHFSDFDLWPHDLKNVIGVMRLIKQGLTSHHTLQVISVYNFYRSYDMTKPTVSKHWRKPVGLSDKAWIPPAPIHHVKIIHLSRQPHLCMA